MSLITQCPACATMFRVVFDQLRVSDGWVRCGQCDEVFDARAHLVTHVPDNTSTDRSTVPVAINLGLLESNESEPAAPLPDAVDVSDGLEHIEVSSFDEFAQDAGATEMECAVQPEPSFTLELPDATHSGATAVEDAAPSISETEDSLPQELVAQADSESARMESSSEPVELPAIAAEALDYSPSFLLSDTVEPARKAWLWWLATAILLLVLSIQGIWYEKDRLYAWHAVWRPSLQQMCLWAGCEIHPWRDTEALTIESSAFVKVHGDVYRLQLDMRSHSEVDLELPAIELSLTDSQDTVLVRKVIPVDQIWNDQRVLPAHGLVSADVVIGLQWPDAEKTMSGYKVFAFYP